VQNYETSVSLTTQYIITVKGY